MKDDVKIIAEQADYIKLCIYRKNDVVWIFNFA